MQTFRTGARVKNGVTGEIATVTGTKQFWIAGRGHITKVAVNKGSKTTEQDKVKYWMPSSLKLIEDELPPCFVTFNHIVELLQKASSNAEKKFMPDLNTSWDGLRVGLDKSDVDSVSVVKVGKIAHVVSLASQLGLNSMLRSDYMRLQNEIIDIMYSRKF